MFATATSVVGSFVLPLLTPNESFQEYATVFRIYAIILVLCNFVFLLFSEAKAAKWTETGW